MAGVVREVIQLEARSLPSTTLANGILTVKPSVSLHHNIYQAVIEQVGSQLKVSEFALGNHQVPIGITFVASADVKLLVMHGNIHGYNILTNDTGKACWLVGGNLTDALTGGSGYNTIDGRGGEDHVFLTNGGVSVLTGDRDVVVVGAKDIWSGGAHEKVYPV
jgi:Ca2+-binding RTX toxin-like protein